MTDIRLSKPNVRTFRGNVVSLRLLSAKDLSSTDIKWSSSDESVVRIRTFQGAEEDCFSDGVLLIAFGCGSAVVTAEYEGRVFSCQTEVREMRTALPDDELRFFFGDFHAHTTEIHDRKRFLPRTDTHPIDVFSQAKEEGYFDSFVVSDHAVLVDNREFFSVFLAAETTDSPDFISFAGTESQVDCIEPDAYGRLHQNAGEVVTFNSAGYASVKGWDEYFERTSQNPMTVAAFAHPQILGYSVAGIWNFSLFEKTTPQMRERFHMIEMGNGGDRGQNLIHERMYSAALDCGYRIAPTSTSDHHCQPWGSNSVRGRTVILAPEKSREMFLDAILNGRLYATENGSVKLWYTVNGFRPASTLPLCEEYNFHVDISHFREIEDGEKTVLVEVVSDYGDIVYSRSVDPADAVVLDFTLQSSSARYFYLRLHSQQGDRTWSPAVWTGREFDPCPAQACKGVPMDKNEMRIVSCTPGTDPRLLISGNPDEEWRSDASSAEFILDLGAEKNVCGVGCWPHKVRRDDPECTDLISVARFIDRVECYVSSDGMHYEKAAAGLVRSHGGEYRLNFAKRAARYVKVLLPDSTGSASRKPNYQGQPVMVGEVDVYVTEP